MPNCPLTLRTVKGSKLTFNELDGNFLSLNSCISNLQSQIDALGDNSLNNRWHVPLGTTVVIDDGYQGFVYGDLYVEGLIELNGDSQLVVVNGDIIISGGTISGTGTTYLVNLPTYNTFVTGGTYNTPTQSIDLSGNYGFNSFSIDLSSVISNSLNNRWHVPVGTTVVVNDGYQGFVYGDLYVEGLIELNGNSQLVVVNGDIIMSGGTISGTGVTYLVDLPTYDSFVTGGTYNISTQSIDLSGNYGFNPFSVDLSSLSTDNFYLTAGTYNSLTNNIDFTGNNIATDFSVNVLALSNDITVVSGVYNNTTGIATFTNSTGGTFDVSGFLTGYTNYYTTGATLNGTTIEFDRTDLLNAYSVDLSSLKFTGNTSGDCISDLHVSNIHSCSPLNINPLDEGNVYFGSTSGVTIDVTNSRIGIGTSLPDYPLHILTSASTIQYQSDIEGGALALSGNTGIPRLDVFGNGPFAVSLGVVASGVTESTYATRGKPTDSYLRASVFSNGLNIINAGPGGGDDYIRFYAGKNVNSSSSDIHIQGSGSTIGYVGIGIDSPSAKLHVNNTSSGNSFLVEDSTNPDSTPFVIDTSGNVGIGTTTPSAKLYVNGNSIFSGATTDVVKIYGSGTTTPIFSVQGSSGELFSISDSLVGSLFSVNDISGLPILETFSDNTVLMGSYQAPSLNTTIKKTLSSGNNTVYSIPTSAYTGAFFDYTLISSTGARAGNVMAIWSGTSSQYTDVSTNDIGDTSGVIFSVSVTGTTAMFSSSANTSGWTLKTIVRSI